MRRLATTLFLITALLITTAGTTFVSLVTANPYAPLHLPKITINSNGSVSPENNSYITKTGNTYTLTADIIREYSIEIQCSNIVFDGAGHVVDVAVNGSFSIDGYPAFYVDVGINLADVHNVIIKNVKVIANNINTVNLQFSSNCQIIGVTTGKSVRILGDFNTVTESNTGITVKGSNNLITRNNITDVFVGSDCYSNKFYQNNFYLTDYPDFFTESLWDNGDVGNYWSNYTIKYLNASEIQNTGIGNTPYYIERGFYTSRDFPKQKNIDRYPLMYPWGAPSVSVFSLENAMYFGSFLLNFSVSKPSVWIGYSLDGKDNVTITENVTIDGLSSGLHTIRVYARDTFGNTGASKIMSFNIAEPENFPTVIVATISTASITIVATGLLLLRRKHEATSTPP